MRNFTQLFGSNSDGSVMVGSPIMLPDTTPPLLERDGRVFAMSGTVITDPTKFDPIAFTMPHIPAGVLVSTPYNQTTPTVQVIDNAFYRYWTYGGNWTVEKSTDGQTYAPLTIPNLGAFAKLVKMDGLWMLGGSWNYGQQAYYWTSTDGETWTRRASVWSLSLNGTTTAGAAPVTPLFSFKGRMYVGTMRLSTGDGDELYSTVDGVSFRKETLPANMSIGAVVSAPAFVDGSRIAVVSCSRLVASVNRREFIFTVDGSTWQLATLPSEMTGLHTPGAAPGFAQSIGFIAGQFEIFDYVRNSTGAVIGHCAIYRTADFQAWTIEVVPTNAHYFTPGAKTFYLSDGNVDYQTHATIGWCAGWYWLSSTFEKGKIYMSKDAKTWIKRTIVPTEQRYYPRSPVALGNKLLFTDSISTGPTPYTCLLEFDQTIIAAGSSDRYTEGNFVQFVRTL